MNSNLPTIIESEVKGTEIQKKEEIRIVKTEVEELIITSRQMNILLGFWMMINFPIIGGAMLICLTSPLAGGAVLTIILGINLVLVLKLLNKRIPYIEINPQKGNFTVSESKPETEDDQ